MAGRIRRILIAIAVWLLIAAGVSVYLFIREQKTTEYTAYNDCSDSGYSYYIMDNTSHAGLLRQMSYEGEITGLFSTREFAYLDGWRIVGTDTVAENAYAVFTRTKNDGGRIVNEYACVIFNEAMQVNYLTAPFRFPMELNLTGFSAEEDALYLTALSDNGMQVYVYMIRTSDMMSVEDMSVSKGEVNEWEETSINVTEYMMDNSSSLRFFSEAEYEDGVLYIRSDNTEEGHFTIDPTVAELYRNRKESLRTKLRASSLSGSVIAVVTVIGIMVIILLFLLLHARLRMTYVVFLYELLLLLLMVGIFAFFTRTQSEWSGEEYERYASASMEGIFDGYSYMDLMDNSLYDTDTYQILLDRMRRVAEYTNQSPEKARDEDLDINREVVDLIVVNRNNQQISLSISGKNYGNVQTLYGRAVGDAVISAASNNGSVLVKDSLQGRPVSILAVSLRDEGYSDYVVVELIGMDASMEGIWKQYGLLLRFTLIIFLIGSIVGIIFFALESRDLARLQAALGKLAAGDDEIRKPAVLGRDLNYMWNSLFEIRKNILQTNRIKFLTYEAYYRFAPKSVERILQKQSITEVQIGDASRLQGTLALLSTAGQMSGNQYETERMDRILVTMETIRKEHDGIFISHDNDFSVMELLFLEKNLDTISFGVDYLQKLRDKKESFSNVTVLMHYAPFVYGVAGTDEQASVYLSSQELSYLRQYIDWFRSMRLGLIVTEEVLEHENVEVDLRYIGFVAPEGRKIRLYEVLDAESTRVHTMRLRQNDRFGSALDSFYKQDFYLARSAFTEIVREAPDDALAKWYLFECEHYLNEAAPENFVGELRMGNRES